MLLPKKCNGCGLFGGKNVEVVEYSLEKNAGMLGFSLEKVYICAGKDGLI